MSMILPHIEADRDFTEAVVSCDKLLTQKGHDYTQGASDKPDVDGYDKGRLKNFYTTAEKKQTTPFMVLGILMDKHLSAIDTFIAKGGLQTESEPIEGRIHDAINYMLLLYKMVKYEKRQMQAVKEAVLAVRTGGDLPRTANPDGHEPTSR